MRLYDQAKECMTMKDQVMRRWMLHVNVSRKGYGNALIGRYSGCFEDNYTEAYDDRVYHAKDLVVPAKFSPTLEVRRAIHGTEEASKIWMVEVPTLEYSH